MGYSGSWGLSVDAEIWSGVLRGRPRDSQLWVFLPGQCVTLSVDALLVPIWNRSQGMMLTRPSILSFVPLKYHLITIQLQRHGLPVSLSCRWKWTESWDGWRGQDVVINLVTGSSGSRSGKKETEGRAKWMKGALEEAASRNVQTHEGYEFSMPAAWVSAPLASFSAFLRKCALALTLSCLFSPRHSLYANLNLARAREIILLKFVWFKRYPCIAEVG